MAPHGRGRMEANRSILLFDGVCNLCSWAVRFVIQRDPGGRVQFASLQSKTAEKLLAAHGVAPPPSAMGSGLSSGHHETRTLPRSSVILLEGGQAYSKSTAVLRVCRHLLWPWPLLYLLMVVPKPLRDGAYDFVANNRYRWFGEACLLPTLEVQGRFLDGWDDR